ncbi:LysR family transcriptional regulator substrate-binding protein [Occultella aeris]|uniref:LysR substrate binding domain protein n=1 Tax=Occultella aeris TaxID=2761496 RepID=A0A7M4DKB1_9MICO|nr:LysR family transcriptional regulator substrate-binding protein [Occultella aeris]VZO37508.1 LysR substrate binding domain protein [Occultella aeris]
MLADADETAQAPGFRLGYVPGVTPAKWVRIWQERHRIPLMLVPLEPATAAADLVAGLADAALAGPPLDAAIFSAITVYVEEPVVMVSRDHLFAALGEDEPVTAADLADQTMLHPLDDVLYTGAADLPGLGARERPATTAAAVELVAAGIGVLVVPKSLARLHHRKDVTHRSLDGGPEAPVQLAWVSERTTDQVEDLVGIVRGRTVNSSRGRQAEPDGGASSASAAPRGEGQGGRTRQGGNDGKGGRGRDGSRAGGRGGKGGRARGSTGGRRGGSGRRRG